MASPKAREAVVLVVGAKSRGQASCDIPVSIFIFELLAIVESLDPVIEKKSSEEIEEQPQV